MQRSSLWTMTCNVRTLRPTRVAITFKSHCFPTRRRSLVRSVATIRPVRARINSPSPKAMMRRKTERDAAMDRLLVDFSGRSECREVETVPTDQKRRFFTSISVTFRSARETIMWSTLCAMKRFWKQGLRRRFGGARLDGFKTLVVTKYPKCFAMRVRCLHNL